MISSVATLPSGSVAAELDVASTAPDAIELVAAQRSLVATWSTPAVIRWRRRRDDAAAIGPCRRRQRRAHGDLVRGSRCERRQRRCRPETLLSSLHEAALDAGAARSWSTPVSIYYSPVVAADCSGGWLAAWLSGNASGRHRAARQAIRGRRLGRRRRSRRPRRRMIVERAGRDPHDEARGGRLDRRGDRRFGVGKRSRRCVRRRRRPNGRRRRWSVHAARLSDPLVLRSRRPTATSRCWPGRVSQGATAARCIQPQDAGGVWQGATASRPARPSASRRRCCQFFSAS